MHLQWKMDGYLSDSDTEFESVDDDRDYLVPSSEYNDRSADINDYSHQSFEENTSPRSFHAKNESKCK